MDLVHSSIFFESRAIKMFTLQLTNKLDLVRIAILESDHERKIMNTFFLFAETFFPEKKQNVCTNGKTVKEISSLLHRPPTPMRTPIL